MSAAFNRALAAVILHAGGHGGLRLTPDGAMPLERVAIPVLVVHHEEDGSRIAAWIPGP